MKRVFSWLAAVWLAPQLAAAVQLSDYLPANVDYDPEIPTPRSVLGWEVGEWHVRHDLLVQYMHVLADVSDRVQLEETGRTYEQRPLLLLTITSPSNHARIEDIRQEHVALTRPGASTRPLDELPVVAYMGYSVHGNEPSGANASMLMAYHLAAARGAEIEQILSATIVLLDPALNPDGLSRFAQWANMHRSKSPVADAQSREHQEHWPSGRTNHYWFDLNRDWLPVQHPESKARLRSFHRWKPNVLTDHHEMGSNATYFFQPGVPTRRNPLTPERNVELTHTIASYHARSFDAQGRLYYSEETFDDYYYGKGSTYPDVNGGIGILFEQASSRGHRRESVQGEFDFPFTIGNQFTTSLSTLQAAYENRQELLSYQQEFYRSARDLARSDPVKGYVFGDPAERGRTYHLLDILLRHEIEVHELSQAHDAGVTRFVPGAAYVVPLDQAQYRLAKTLFEQRTTFDDSLFYDVSTWTLPLALGVRFAELRKSPDGLLGNRVVQAQLAEGRAPDDGEAYAYVFPWHEYYAPRALNRLLVAGVRPRVATRRFAASTDAGRVEFDYGTIVVPMGAQETDAATIRDLVTTIAREDGVDVFAATSGLTPGGIDLGSPSMRVLSRPRPLLLVGGEVSTYEAGEVWHLFDQRFNIGLTLIDINRFDRVDLHDYTHVIMVGGGYSQISERRADDVKSWLRDGGVLIAIKQAVRWVDETEIVDLEFVPQADEAENSKGRQDYVNHERQRGAHIVSGAIFATDVDRTHPLGYGFRDRLLPVFRNHRIVLNPSSNPYGTVVQYADAPLLSGYISDENLERLGGTASVVAHRVGDGTVVMLLDNPNFRAFWYGTNTLLLNALFFGSVIERTGE